MMSLIMILMMTKKRRKGIISDDSSVLIYYQKGESSITGVQGVDKHPGVLYQPCLRLQASPLFIKIAFEGSIDRNMMLVDPPGMMLRFLRRTS